jgi:diguanylate cyclase (GGDEF)-like protein
MGMKDEVSVEGDLLYQGTGVPEMVPVGELLEAIDSLLPDFSFEEPHIGDEISQEVFDKTLFLNRMLGDTDLAQEVTGLFLSHHRELLSAVRQAFHRKDCEALLAAVQSLKGPIGIFAASKALKHVGHLEVFARNQYLAPVGQVLMSLEEEMACLTRELSAIWDKGDSGNILIADDDPVTRKLLQATLAKCGHEPVVCADGAQAIRALSSSVSPKVAILDWLMPGLDGVQVCRDLRTRKEGPPVYVILLTGKDRPDEIIEGLDAGADDYLVKPFDPDDLRARLRRGFRCINLKDDLACDSEIETPHRSLDRLTGLGTRDSLLVSVKRNIASHRGAGELLAILMIQVERTQAIKAKFSPGSKHLIFGELAKRLRLALKPQDNFGLYEDDKFLCIMTREDKDNIIKTTRSIRSALTSAPITVEERPFSVVISVGGTVITGSRPVAVGSAILAAEAALGSSRGRGPNNVVFTPIKSSGIKEATPEIPKEETASRRDLELIVAARGGNLDLVSNLIKRGSNVNAGDKQGNTALIEAASFKYPEVVRFLLKKGADPRIRNKAGDSALTEAVRTGDTRTVNLLLARLTPADVIANSGALYRSLFEVSSSGNPGVAHELKKYLAAAGLQLPPAGKSRI